MQIDHCLILAAGFGTRMGTIGQKLPKVLWPVFERPLLELQVAYAKSLGIKKIFINLHHMGKEIEEFAKGKSVFEDVTFLLENPEILDIGGGIHNVAAQKNVNYRGKLLVLNADQFFYLKRDDLEKQLSPFQNAASVLFTYWVDSSSGYNALIVDPKRIVKEIINNKDLPPATKVETYTGISLIDLSKLDKVPGPSKFFDSVCSYKTKEVNSILLENIDYWDFGTLKRFWETSFRILETYRVNSNHPFLRFLVSERALKTWKIDLQNIAYHSKTPRFINLAPDLFNSEAGSGIVMSQAKVTKKSGLHVYWGDLSEEVK